MVKNYTERPRGSDCTGTDGDKNRTFTLATTDFDANTLTIVVNQLQIHLTAQYTLSGTTITFLDEIYDEHYLTLAYDGTAASTDGSLSFTSALGLIKHIGALETIPSKDFVDANGDPLDLEEVGTGDGTKSTYWLDKIGVIDDTYTLYYGTANSVDSATALTDVTHYVLDLNMSKVTLTAAGITLVSGSKVYAAYSHNNRLGLLNPEMVNALLAAEQKITRKTESRFAEYTDNSPNYLKTTDEVFEGHFDPIDKTFEVSWLPIVDLRTTVNGAYTTGGAEIILTSATGFPSSGTIYIGGNKVAYTSKSSNTLTIPTSTPSIADAAVVRGEVIEVSKEAEGNNPSWTVIDPEKEYEIDYMDGSIAPLANAYWGILSASDVVYPSNYKVRMSYMHAWHEPRKTPTVPQDIYEIAYMIAAKKFAQRVIKAKHIGGFNEFKPTAVNSGDVEINEALLHYTPLRVGRSNYNKKYIT